MKKFMSIMLAMALTIGVASITVAQDKTDDTKKSTKKGKNKKAKTDATKSDSKADTKGKTKGKKGKDGDAPPTK